MKKVKIDSIEDFQMFLNCKKKFASNIVLNLKIIESSKNEYYSKIINENRNACGCETGSVFMSISIVVGIIWFNVFFGGLNKYFAVNFLYFLVFVLVFSIIGKLIGLIIAKIKLEIILKEIEAIIYHNN